MKRPLLCLALLTMASASWANTGDYCTTPGELVVDGPLFGTLSFRVGVTDGSVPNPLPGQQIEALYWAEPAAFNDQVVISMQVDTLQPAAPASDQQPVPPLYQVFFELADGQRYYVLYDPAAEAGRQFTYGSNVEINSSDSADTQLGVADEQSLAEPSGLIQWVLSRSKVPAFYQSAAAQSIYGLVKVNDPSSGGYRGVNAVGTGEYVLRGNQSCGGAKSSARLGGAGSLGSWLLGGLLAFAAARRVLGEPRAARA